MSIHGGYPKEFFVPINGSSYHLGRLCVNLAHDGITVEIDIVLKDSRKIWTSVKRLYRQDNEEDAISNGVQALGDYLRNQSL